MKPDELGHTSNGRGTLMLARVFPPPIGKIRMATGTKDSNALRDIHAMLDAMIWSVPPRWDIVIAIKEKRIHPMYALSLWRLNKLNELPPADLLPLFAPSATEWLKTTAFSDKYRQGIEETIRALCRLKPDPTLGDVPALLRLYRAKCAAANHPATFNRSKAQIQAFVRDTLTKRHTLYKDVVDVPRLKPNQQPIRRAQKPVELGVLLANLPPPYLRMAWSMAVTGMGPKEYWGMWETADSPAYVHVHGTKRKARVRNVPRWITSLPERPTRSRHTFRTIWKRKLGNDLGIYDLRRSFAVWMEDAGIPRSRRKMYMGHAAGDVTDLYETRELRQWLGEDAERLRGYAGNTIDAAVSA